MARRRTRRSPSKRRRPTRSRSRSRSRRRGLRAAREEKLLDRGQAPFWGPPLIGGGLTALTLIGIRQFTTATAGTFSQMLHRWAPAVGILVGGGAGIALSRTLSKDANAMGATTGALTGAALVGLTPLVTEMMMRDNLLRAAAGDVSADGAVAAVMAPDNGAAANGTAGLRAIVPQYGALPSNGMGAIVMEQLRGNEQEQGAVVDLKGTVEAGAFGTAPYGA